MSRKREEFKILNIEEFPMSNYYFPGEYLVTTAKGMFILDPDFWGSISTGDTITAWIERTDLAHWLIK